MEELTQREKIILQSLVHNFITAANPVSSERLQKKYNLRISPATIRNVMMDLEEKGLVCQPHAFAGRIPTDKGYRVYVDCLMKPERLSREEKRVIHKDLTEISPDVDAILQRASHVLGEISKQLGVVLSPRFYQGVFEKMELIHVAERRILIVLTIRSGLVKTIMMELNSDISRDKLEEISRVLNERLSGLTLKEIRDSIDVRMRDLPQGEVEFIKFFVDSADSVFDFEEWEEFYFDGTSNIMSQPEFSQWERIRDIIELLEDKKLIIRLFNRVGTQKKLSITIGEENPDERMKRYSVITAPYSVGEVTGTLGIIGPTRMRYAKVIPLVDYVAQVLGNVLSSN